MKIEIPDFKEFPDDNLSGRMIVNPFWLEHLLNLFFQGYLAEAQMEIWDTQDNSCKGIEDWGLGIIGQEFDKKHLDLSNSITPCSNSSEQTPQSEVKHNE